MRMRLHLVDLPLRHTFTIAHGSTAAQRSVIVELDDGRHQGFGEGCPSAYHGISAEQIANELEAARELIESTPLDSPEEYWQHMLPTLGGNRFALCALDQAAHDLFGKRAGQPLHRLWGLDPARLPLTNYTIGIDTIERMVAKMREFPDWPIYKIKLGTPDDVAIVRELREHTDAVFRVDANTAWTADETIENAHALQDLNVEFIEQPLPVGDTDGMRRVHAESALPIIADETCQIEEDVAKCAGLFDGVNIKLTKCGGLTPGRRMIDEARRLGLKVMVGCMTESTVGCSAIAQLLPLLDYVDMDGPLLVAKDVATGVTFDRGRPILPPENGAGVRLLR